MRLASHRAAVFIISVVCVVASFFFASVSVFCRRPVAVRDERPSSIVCVCVCVCVCVILHFTHTHVH